MSSHQESCEYRYAEQTLKLVELEDKERQITLLKEMATLEFTMEGMKREEE